MLKKDSEKIWKILNEFRMKKFITNSVAEIKIDEFDKLLDEIQKIILKETKHKKQIIQITNNIPKKQNISNSLN